MISARLDGELPDLDCDGLDRHLAGCPSCSAHQDQAISLRRSMRLHAAETLASLEAPASLSPGPAGIAALRGTNLLRWALFVIGGTLVLINGSDLIASAETADRHLSHHDAVFGAALGIGMLSVAWKPHRAIGLVPLTSAIALLMSIVALTDVMNDTVTVFGEAIHVVELAGLTCLWVISGGLARAQRRIGDVTARLRRRPVPRLP